MAASFSDTDLDRMSRALRLARRAQGFVEPNPMVGAVITRHDRVVGEGFHRRFGGPHAEVWALRAAGARARGGTLYVTLEPCCHWGKTPPCTDAILAAGISRVVIATIDPFARVRGKGAALLRRRGLRVEVGLLEAEARELNAPFFTRISAKRPFIIAKWAQSVDGCIATASGESRWISSEISRDFVQDLRGRVDGIVVGIATALDDDPLLTARPARPRNLRRIATRIVLDSQCRLPLESRLVRTVADAPLLVVHRRDLTPAAERRRKALAARGATTLAIPSDKTGRIRIPALLAHLAEQEYTNLLVEGGAQTMAAFFAADAVDEAHIFTAPIVIGGPNARRAVGGRIDLPRLSDAHALRFVEVARSGPDLHLVLRRR